MTPDVFITDALAAAIRAQHIWPEYATCEAALESAWGESELARKANNLFGQKHGFSTTAWPTIALGTHEVIAGKVVAEDANWPVFPDWETSFRERMRLLQLARNPDESLKYADALAAQTGEEFVVRVSRTWATDPFRASKVLQIYRAHFASQQRKAESA